jgi:enamine deaminase RidA (YjgF/YER057c/UK114 family)
MTIERLNPDGLEEVPGISHVTIATGSRIVHVSGQTGVDGDGNIVGPTHQEQAKQALLNLKIAADAAGVTAGDAAKVMLYVVDYSDDALGGIFAGLAEFEAEVGEAFPPAASTLVGVTALWQPGLLIEIDAVYVAD